jgi:hypothetical protein
MENAMSQKLIGRYIVVDPQICHGKPTFRGTRIMVSQVFHQVASGMAWETIVDNGAARSVAKQLPKPLAWRHKPLAIMPTNM